MRTILLAAATATLCSGVGVFNDTAAAQETFLDGYNRARERNQLETLRNLQMLQQAQQIMLMEQQREALRLQQQQQQRDQYVIQEQQRRQSIEEAQVKGRKLIAEIEKDACVTEFVNDVSKRDALHKFGIPVGQFCACIEHEILAILTLDLSARILLAMSEAAGDRQRFISTPAAVEYTNRYTTARTGCIAQMVKAR